MATPGSRFTISLVKGIGGLALQPVIPASALLFLACGRPDLVGQVANHEIIKKIGLDTVKKILKTLLSLGIVRVVNGFWNRVAGNNWHILSHPGWKWTNEIAVITGGCNGIGKSILLGLVAKGVRVAILDVAELPPDLAMMDNVYYWRCDITSPEAVREAADDIRRTLGHPSILINNAGIAPSGSILEVSHRQLSRVIGINLQALWTTTKEFLPTMVLKDKGHIVTIASVASYVALPANVDYSATKAGALAFHEGLACEIKNAYKSPGVLTTVIHPNFVNTDMTRGSKDKIEKGTGTMLRVEDVSRPILKHIFGCYGGQIFAPGSIWHVSLFRSFPNWMQESFRDTLGRGAGVF